ncbi:hypothetical protein V9L05_01230 [Bernardetia sp. Wsw4-3y2]|uniref:hypothetical protein n=1 Tax=Bernardetia sp. Wsw4-3y2 TaxID=3127471 RepID=UPI0030D19240
MAVTLNSASFLKPDTLTPRLAWARNVVFINLQADANWHLNNSYYLELEIGIFDINTLSFAKLGESLIEEPSSSGTVIFEIQQKMQDYQGINIPVPNFNSTQIVQHTTPKFYIKIFEVVNGTKTQIPLDGMSGSIENRYYLVEAVDAALDRENFSYQQQEDWFFGDILNGDRRFLTSVEDPKSTTKYANEFLYWFASQANRDLTVDCKIYYDDDTEETVRLFDYLPGYHIQCIPTRYDIIKAKSTQPFKNIIAWSVYAAYNSFLVSQYFRYEIADQPNREAKYFLAKNSFGVFDTLVCQGDFEEFLEVENETASKRDFANYALTDAQKFIISQKGTRGGTANTAFLNRLQSVVKQDFVLSREMLIQAETGFIPIFAEKIKHIYSQKNNGLIGLSFEYEHAHNVKHYTNKIFRPVLGEVPTPPTLPKFTIRNTGAVNSYVRVEYDAITIDVAPNSEESIEIGESVSITVTWGIVDLDLGFLDDSTIDISYPNYSFPSRIINATFDSVVQAGNTVVSIPDQNSVKRARSFTFSMPNNDYFAEIKFRELELLLDYNFEDPYCVDSVNDGQQVVTLKDRINRIPQITQSTPTLRGTKQNNYINLSANQKYQITYPSIPSLAGTSVTTLSLFFVGKATQLANSNILEFWDNTSNYLYGSARLAYGSGKLFTAYNAGGGGTSNLIPSFSSYLNMPFLFRDLQGSAYQFGSMNAFVDGQYFSHSHHSHIKDFFPLQGITVGGAGATDIYRILQIKDSITTEESNIITEKLKEKYSVL